MHDARHATRRCGRAAVPGQARRRRLRLRYRSRSRFPRCMVVATRGGRTAPPPPAARALTVTQSRRRRHRRDLLEQVLIDVVDYDAEHVLARVVVAPEEA